GDARRPGGHGLPPSGHRPRCPVDRPTRPAASHCRRGRPADPGIELTPERVHSAARSKEGDMPRSSSPTIQEFRVRAVRVPMTEPHQTAGGVVAESPLVLTDVITDAGISGHSMVFTYTPAALRPTAELIRNVELLVKGEELAPAEIEQKLARRFRLLGTQGLVGIALAAIDMALWDALARVHGLPLVRLLGGA